MRKGFLSAVLKLRMRLIVPRRILTTSTMAMLMRVERLMRSTAMSQEERIEMITRREFYIIMTVMSCFRRIASLFQEILSICNAQPSHHLMWRTISRCCMQP